MATTFTGGLKSILNSTNTSRADIHVNNMEADGDFDIKGELCVNDGVKDNVCLTQNGISIDPNTDTANTLDIVRADGVTQMFNVDSLNEEVKVNKSMKVTTNDTDDAKIQFISDEATDTEYTCGLDVSTGGVGSRSFVFSRGLTLGTDNIFKVDFADRIMDVTEGITLPTSGGNASTLDYYEQYLGTDTISGPWASPQPFNYRIVRIGKIVTIFLPAVSATGSSGGLADTVTDLVGRFRPVGSVRFPVVVDNQGVNAIGVCTISTGGNIQFAKDAAVTGFDAGGASVGWSATQFSYEVL